MSEIIGKKNKNKTYTATMHEWKACKNVSTLVCLNVSSAPISLYDAKV